MAGILKVDTIQNSNASNIVTQTNTTTITIGTSGQTVALASGATSSGFGATYNGAVNWDTTIKTTGFTAVSGTGYFCNTTSAAFTVTLPSSPSAGAIVAFKDYATTWNTNNLIIERNGSNIEGSANNYVGNTAGLSVTLIYVDSTKGWIVINAGDDSNIAPQALYVAATGGTVTTCGNYKIHTFTSSGCFVVSSAGNSTGSNSVEYLVVAGGGSGGGKASGCSGAGGGGAGGYRQNYPSPASAGLPVTATTYPVTVGGGGSGGTAKGSSGSNSVFSTITSAGGGGGATGQGVPVSCATGIPGGSGGGGSTSGSPNAVQPGGTGNSPPVTPSQGSNGGSGSSNFASYRTGGGGGGASATGGTYPNTNGGAGSANSISGSSTTYAGGGGGGGVNAAAGSGGPGGGGAAGPGSSNGTAGTANTGGGGGGVSNGPASGGSGGSGIVVIRYKYQ